MLHTLRSPSTQAREVEAGSDPWIISGHVVYPDQGKGYCPCHQYTYQQIRTHHCEKYTRITARNTNAPLADGMQCDAMYTHETRICIWGMPVTLLENMKTSFLINYRGDRESGIWHAGSSHDRHSWLLYSGKRFCQLFPEICLMLWTFVRLTRSVTKGRGKTCKAFLTSLLVSGCPNLPKYHGSIRQKGISWVSWWTPGGAEMCWLKPLFWLWVCRACSGPGGCLSVRGFKTLVRGSSSGTPTGLVSCPDRLFVFVVCSQTWNLSRINVTVFLESKIYAENASFATCPRLRQNCENAWY